ncbi:MAG: metallophosphoesterase [Armatimonadetes bacterium]|nr:metallophosphoesterase [Armatimonadota bacterium]MDE2206014.1 metallophosphoesterase [Armatimonadota bacterium]
MTNSSARTIHRINIGRRISYPVEVTEHTVRLEGISEAWVGATIAQITDIHAGFARLESVYDTVVRLVCSRRPTVILFTGDFVNDSRPGNSFRIRELLSRFSAPCGLFGSPGNHDHRRGWQATLEDVEAAGVRILCNANVRLPGGLWLAGIDDLDDGKPDLEATLRGIETGEPAVLMSHNPRTIERVGDRPLLVLSGHTHGGQFRLPFPTPGMVCRWHLNCRQVAGWYTNGRAQAYVSRGVGVTGQPFRINCPAEVAFFTLAPSVPQTATSGSA